jgi:hypothetical protein
VVVDLGLTAGFLDSRDGRVEQASREHEVTVDGLLVGPDEATDAPCRLSSPLSVVELGVGHGCCMRQGGVQRRTELVCWHADPAVEMQVHEGC